MDQVIYHLRKSLSGRWGYRPGSFLRGLLIEDAESGSAIHTDASADMGAYTITDIPESLEDTAPDGVSLPDDFVDMSHAEFVQAYTDKYGDAPLKTIVFAGDLDDNGAPLFTS